MTTPLCKSSTGALNATAKQENSKHQRVRGGRGSFSLNLIVFLFLNLLQLPGVEGAGEECGRGGVWQPRAGKQHESRRTQQEEQSRRSRAGGAAQEEHENTRTQQEEQSRRGRAGAEQGTAIRNAHAHTRRHRAYHVKVAIFVRPPDECIFAKHRWCTPDSVGACSIVAHSIKTHLRGGGKNAQHNRTTVPTPLSLLSG